MTDAQRLAPLLLLALQDVAGQQQQRRQALEQNDPAS